MSVDNYPSWEDGQKWKEKAEKYEAAIRGATHELESIDMLSDLPKIQNTPSWRAGNAINILRDAIKEPAVNVIDS